jgi:hypothetical protein
MKTIDTQCGIYNTEYRLIKHKDGSISVKTPYIKWVNNSGSLAFKNVKITRFVEAALDCFNDTNAEMSISEIVYENELINEKTK